MGSVKTMLNGVSVVLNSVGGALDSMVVWLHILLLHQTPDVLCGILNKIKDTCIACKGSSIALKVYGVVITCYLATFTYHTFSPFIVGMKFNKLQNICHTWFGILDSTLSDFDGMHSLTVYIVVCRTASLSDSITSNLFQSYSCWEISDRKNHGRSTTLTFFFQIKFINFN